MSISTNPTSQRVFAWSGRHPFIEAAVTTFVPVTWLAEVIGEHLPADRSATLAQHAAPAAAQTGASQVQTTTAP